jgi:hypothetical protein
MTRREWIVCERSPRWTPALRTALANLQLDNTMDCSPTRKQGIVGATSHKSLACASGSDQLFAPARQVSLYEVRNLTELTARTEQQSNSFVFVEVIATNVDATLEWLAASRHDGNGCRIVAVLDQSIDVPAVAAALREAGVIDVANSPRRLQNAIRLGLLHTAAMQPTSSTRPGNGQTFEEWARSLLPWQVAH